MGTLNTTINLSSADTLPFVLNQSFASSGTTGNFVESGVKHLQTFTQEFFISGEGSLSNKNCGPNGIYVFIQSPVTNTNTVKIYGQQQINEELAEETFSGIESFATLKPGDSIIVNLSAQQEGIFAATNFGEATINYYIADRGGEFGESILFVDQNTDTNFRYIVMDSQLADILPSGYPVPYRFESPNSADLGLARSAYNFTGSYIVNNKGYILQFNEISNNSHNIWKCINSRGEIAGIIDVTGGYSYYELNKNGFLVIYPDGGDIVIKHFNGDTLDTHTFVGSDYEVSYDWDEVSANGSFIVWIYDYNEISQNTATILINKETAHIINEDNYGTTGKYVDDAAVQLYGNFAALLIYDDNEGWYDRLQIWNTNGVLLKDIDVSGYQFQSRDYWMYGENKFLVIFNNGSNLATANTDYIVSYDGTTNTLAGVSNTFGLICHHSNTGDYGNRRVYAYSKYPTDSIRPYNYTWNSGLFDANSVAIVYADTVNNSYVYHLNSTVNYCDIVYLLDKQTIFTTYKFADDQTRYIRIPSDGKGNSGNYRINPSSNLIQFTYGVNGNVTGSLNTLSITSTGVATGSLIPELDDVYNEYYDIVVKPVGDYIMYNWYTPGNNTTTYAMVKNATIKDTVNIAGDAQYSGVWRMRTNSLLLRSWNYNSPRNWYFDITTNKFVELTAGGAAFNASKPYYPQHRFSKCVTTNGLNDGNILLGPSGGNISPENQNNNMRLLKKGTVTANATLPSTDGDWDLELGSEAVFFIYQDMNDFYKYKVNVYDLNLKLIRTVPLLTDSLDFYNGQENVIGKRLYIRTFNADPLGTQNTYSYYVISLNGVAFWSNGYTSNELNNDMYWWDFIN